MDAVVKSSSEFSSFSEFYKNSAYADFKQEHRSGGSFEVGMIEVDQDGHELIDPPIAELFIVGFVKTSGKGELDFGDGWTKPIEVRPNMFGPQPMNQECRFRIEASHTVLVACVPAHVVNRQLNNVGIFEDPFRSLYTNFSNDTNGLSHLRGMWNAMQIGGPANNLLVDAHVISLLGLMMVEAHDVQKFIAAPTLDNHRLAQVIDYIETHFSAPLLTTELASIAAMSPVHFNRSFKAATGYAPHHYVTLRRVEHSRRMLQTKSLAITEIAYLCGFASPSHFSTTFNKIVGQSPSEFRIKAQVR
jgi:AraC family transcriptional regulator